MNQKSWMAAVLVLLSAFAAREALAVDPGWYGGANVGLARVDDNVNSFSIKDSTFSWKVLGGYRLNQYVGVEGSYVRLGEFSQNLVDLKVHGGTVEGVGYFPLSPTIDVYGKLGAFFWGSNASVGAISADSDGTDIVGGVGARFRLADKYGISGEWERYGSDQTVNFFSVGVDYMFK